MKVLLHCILPVLMLLTAKCQEFPLARSIPSKTAPFAIDPSAEFHFAFGRGSGMDGLDTILFGRDGIVTLHRKTSKGRWQTATITLDSNSIRRILETTEAEHIMAMSAKYHADVSDGSQWILWITQGSRSKSIYFDNYFPQGIRRLATVLDSELAAAGIAAMKWKGVPMKESRLHEESLWNSIK